jgi:hypothetical protein
MVETRTVEIEVEVPVKIAESIESGQKEVTPILEID